VPVGPHGVLSRGRSVPFGTSPGDSCPRFKKRFLSAPVPLPLEFSDGLPRRGNSLALSLLNVCPFPSFSPYFPLSSLFLYRSKAAGPACASNLSPLIRGRSAFACSTNLVGKNAEPIASTPAHLQARPLRVALLSPEAVGKPLRCHHHQAVSRSRRLSKHRSHILAGGPRRTTFLSANSSRLPSRSVIVLLLSREVTEQLGSSSKRIM